MVCHTSKSFSFWLPACCVGVGLHTCTRPSVCLSAFPQSVRGLSFAWRHSFDETSYLAVNFEVGRTFTTSERHEANAGPGSSVPEEAEKEEELEDLEAEETWIRLSVKERQRMENI